MLIGVAGMVGCGKSTLARALSARFGLQLALESAENNPWLESYYGEPEGQSRFALPLQLHFLATRFASMRLMRSHGGSWILDRTWYEDAEVFAAGLVEQGYMTDVEYDLYGRLYAELLHSPAARPPRLLIYLHGPLAEIVQRIQLRGRPKEREMDAGYWESLHSRYAQWIGAFRHCPVLRLDVRDYDLVADPGAVEEVAALLRQRLERELPQTELWPAVGRRPEDAFPSTAAATTFRTSTRRSSEHRPDPGF